MSAVERQRPPRKRPAPRALPVRGSGVTATGGVAGGRRMPRPAGLHSRAMARRGVGGVLRGPSDPELLQRPPVLCYNPAAAFNVA
jgi:hypothetical protein